MHPALDAWQPWRPDAFAERMQGSGLRWYVAGGWAIDLFLDRETREHEDLEVAVPARDFRSVEALFPEMDFWVPRGERRLAPATDTTLAGDSHQTFAAERSVGLWRFDVFREPHDGDTWICRRDTSIRRPYADIVASTASGIPYLLPEVVLLFKAKAARDKDLADLAVARPRMTETQLGWLGRALAQVHPGHAWIADL